VSQGGLQVLRSVVPPPPPPPLAPLESLLFARLRPLLLLR
jgi:hypothetical protein